MASSVQLRSEELALVPLQTREAPPDFEEKIQSLATRLRIVPSPTDFHEVQEQVFEGVLIACKERQWALVQENKDFLSHLTDRAGRTLLMVATSLWDKDTVEQLVLYQIGIHSKDIEGNTTLHFAAKYGALDLLNLLLKHLKIEELNRDGQTPLHVAIFSGQHDVVEALLAKGANIDTKFPLPNGLSISALPWAVMRGEIHCVDAIIKKRGDRHLNINIPGFGTLLHIATAFHQIEMLTYLFAKYPAMMKSLLEEQDSNGLTPFSLASLYGFVEALILFKEQGANIETKDAQGNRPLHQAVLGKQHETIDWLLYLGCKINKANHVGQTPAALAEKIADKTPSSEAQSIANMLQTYSQQSHVIAKPEWMVTRYDNLVFQGGGTKGICYLGSLKYLEEKGALQNVRRVAGTSAGAITAALVAVGYCQRDIQTFLLEKDLSTFLDHPLSAKRLDSLTSGGVAHALYKLYQGTTRLLNPLQMFQDLYHITGLCEGDDFLGWIEEKILLQTKVPHCTFKDLRNRVAKNQAKHLHVYAIKAGSKPDIIHFSSEDHRWDDLVISDAIRCSMSIPGVFKPHTLHFKDSEGRRYPRADLGSHVDAGILYNFPIEAFDRKEFQQMDFLSDDEHKMQKYNPTTLGFSLYSSQDKPCENAPVETVGQLLSSVANLYYNAEEAIRGATSYNVQRVIPLDFQEIGTLTLKISSEQAASLIETAYMTTKGALDPKLSASKDQRFFLTS